MAAPPLQIAFLRGWFQAINRIKAAGRFTPYERMGSDVSDARVVQARDNFVLAASLAARADLSAYFSTLRWPALSSSAADLLRSWLVSAPSRLGVG